MISLSIPMQLAVGAVLCLVLWVACSGVGTALLPRRDGARDEGRGPVSWRQPGIAACVGLGILIALGGLAAAIQLPFWVAVAGFGIAGLVLAVREILGYSWSRMATAVLVTTAVGAVALIAVALLETTVGFRQAAQQCDDLRAYIPLANRLVSTGGLDDAWSFRRLQNLGGTTFLQAIPVGLLGARAIAVAETGIAAVFLGGVFVATGLRTTWARLLGILFVLAIPFLWVPRLNSAPVLLAVPLLLACFGGVVEVRAALRLADVSAALRWAIAVGVTGAAVASLRITLAPVVALSVVVGLAAAAGVGRAPRLRALAAAVGAGMLAIAPWCVATWRSSGTPLYPIIPGNANPAGPPNRAPFLDTVGDQVHHVWGLLAANQYFWLALAVLVAAVIARRLLPDAAAVAIAAGAVVVWIVVFAITGSLVTTWDFGRYIAPMVESLVLFLAYETVRVADAKAPDVVRDRAAMGSVTLAVGLVVVSFLPVGGPLIASGPRSLLLAFGGRGAARQSVTAVSPPVIRAQYRRALRGLDLDRTIVAVDHPALIDGHGHDVPSMDFPGWALPGSTFPFFSGAGPKIQMLRSHGYDTLVVTDPDADACYAPAYVRKEVEEHVPSRESAVFARYFLDWDNDIATIVARAPTAVRRVGNVIVINLGRARTELASSDER
ncbi:MAG: hypothetical protein ACXWA9_06845 [Acidimicrobiia bacterium]